MRNLLFAITLFLLLFSPALALADCNGAKNCGGVPGFGGDATSDGTFTILAWTNDVTAVIPGLCNYANNQAQPLLVVCTAFDLTNNATLPPGYSYKPLTLSAVVTSALGLTESCDLVLAYGLLAEVPGFTNDYAPVLELGTGALNIIRTMDVVDISAGVTLQGGDRVTFRYDTRGDATGSCDGMQGVAVRATFNMFLD